MIDRVWVLIGGGKKRHLELAQEELSDSQFTACGRQTRMGSRLFMEIFCLVPEAVTNHVPCKICEHAFAKLLFAPKEE